MLTLTKRNLKIYFANPVSVFMSCLGALIAFFLYIIFLQKQLVNGWKMLAHPNKLLDLWIIAGIVAIAGITTSFQGLNQFVDDRVNRTSDDLRLTDISPLFQSLSYVLSASLISFVMQIFAFAIVTIYFTLTDHIKIFVNDLWPSLCIMLLAAVVDTVLNLIIVAFIHKEKTFNIMSSILGALSGFLVASYFPIGLLPKVAQDLVKLTPGSYQAIFMRNLLMSDQIKKQVPTTLVKRFKNFLGCQIKLDGYLLTDEQVVFVLAGMGVILLLVVAFINLVNNRMKK
ncbi:ABC transporter permease [Lactobacillus acetotolerans]|uniref:ABC transporter permease n=1 Tax=Lactobacillus acetotolerans TaxID=1600 RepID=UPI0007BAAAE9|nr:ABC transporter permease [Lactobacillus acetotolerans]QGV04139.1 ABC transporter permease [Lactobacillus acetotolerans]